MIDNDLQQKRVSCCEKIKERFFLFLFFCLCEYCFLKLGERLKINEFIKVTIIDFIIHKPNVYLIEELTFYFILLLTPVKELTLFLFYYQLLKIFQSSVPKREKAKIRKKNQLSLYYWRGKEKKNVISNIKSICYHI